MKHKLLIIGCLILLQFTLKAQMKVGDNPTTINSASLLELETTNKGLVFPRVPLTSVSSSSPLPAGLLTGTMVFNTNAAITNGSGVGLYIWSGTAWLSVNTGSTSATAWSLTGNAGTNYATNFIGSTDNVGFRVRTNNLQRILVDSLGDVAIGSTAFNPYNRERLLVDYDTTTSHTVANFRGNINDYLQLNIQNTSGGEKSSSDFVATADDGTDSTFFVDMGINGSHYVLDPENWGNKHDAYLYSNSKNLLIGTQADSSDLYFLLGGGQITENTALEIKGPSGVIVVGKGDLTNSPTGNTIRGPNANITTVNVGGGDLSITGGHSTGTASGGDLNLTGGSATAIGKGGDVNISGGSSTVGPDGLVNINTGTSLGNTKIGSNANNIFLPKFSTAGGLFYTAKTSGLISNTGAHLTWDSINNRLGIGTTTPLAKLDVIGNVRFSGALMPGGSAGSTGFVLTSAGAGAPPTWQAIGNVGGDIWLTKGNSGISSSEFLGTKDSAALVFKVDGIVAGYLGVAGSSTENTLYGTAAQAQGAQSTALGFGAVALKSNSTAVGYTAVAAGVNSTAIGTVAAVTGDSGIALGAGSQAVSVNGISIGTGSQAGQNSNNIAIGTGSVSRGESATAFGNTALAAGISAIAIGDSSAATSINATAIGRKAGASGASSIVLGDNSSTSADNTIIIGSNITTTQSNVLILGNTAKKIGIGTTTPAYKLTIVPQAGNDPLYVNGIQNLTTPVITDSILAIRAGVVKQIRIADLPGSAWSLTGNSGLNATNNFIGTTNNVSMRFRTNNVQRVIIDSLGNVGVGTSTPGNRLEVNGTDPLKLVGLQVGTVNDSLLVITSSGIVKKQKSIGNVSLSKYIVSISIPAIGNNGGVPVTITVPGLIYTPGGPNAVVTVNPEKDLPDGVVIAWVRVTAINTVTILFRNVSNAGVPAGSGLIDVGIIN